MLVSRGEFLVQIGNVRYQRQFFLSKGFELFCIFRVQSFVLLSIFFESNNLELQPLYLAISSLVPVAPLSFDIDFIEDGCFRLLVFVYLVYVCTEGLGFSVARQVFLQLENSVHLLVLVFPAIREVVFFIVGGRSGIFPIRRAVLGFVGVAQGEGSLGFGAGIFLDDLFEVLLDAAEFGLHALEGGFSGGVLDSGGDGSALISGLKVVELAGGLFAENGVAVGVSFFKADLLHRI